MTHACEWCSGKKARRSGRTAVLGFIRLHPTVTNWWLAKHLGACRQTIVGWRRHAETIGCVPKRAGPGRAYWDRRVGSRTPIIHPLAVAYPIGTLWTAKETRRAA